MPTAPTSSVLCPPLTEVELRALRVVLHQAILNEQVVLAVEGPDGASVCAHDWEPEVEQIDFEGEPRPRLALRLGIARDDVETLSAKG